MSSALLSAEEETFPNRIRWTVEECYRLMNEGFLQGRFEVLDGEVVSKMGQNPPHYFALSQLVMWANKAFGDVRVRMQGPISLLKPDNVFSEPEPDLAITRLVANEYATRHPLPEELLLVIEVSDTTLRTDLLVKARLYARASIPEYWTLDLNARTLHVHRNPIEGEYAEHVVLAESEAVSPLAQPESTLSILDILPAA